MLEIRPSCEQCGKALPAESMEARICSYECTYCVACAEKRLENVCPNCGGGFVPRPIRPKTEWRRGVSRSQQPPTAEEVFKPVDLEAHKAFAARLRTISPSER